MPLKLLRMFHIVSMIVFIGSIPTHIILGVVANSSQGSLAFAILHQAKYDLTAGLTIVGMIATLLSGVLVLLLKRKLIGARWMKLKLVFVTLITLNGWLILTPLAERMKDLAIDSLDTGILAADFVVLVKQESIAGGVNLFLLLVIVFLAVVKPSLKVKRETRYG